MSAALKMLLVVYLLRSTWFNSSSRVHASCQCSRCRPERRRPSLVQYCSTAFCFPVLFLWLLAPRHVPSRPPPAQGWLVPPRPGPPRPYPHRAATGEPRYAGDGSRHPPTKDLFSPRLVPGRYRSLPTSSLGVCRALSLFSGTPKSPTFPLEAGLCTSGA